MLNPPLRARNGHRAKILEVTRVSDPRPGKQDIRSLRDQRMLLDDFLKANVDIPYDVVANDCAGKGELIDRDEFVQLMQQVISCEFDLLITEDLARILRRARAIEFVETCVDCGTRLITVNGARIDTAVQGWQDSAFLDSWLGERSNRDTSDRIKRTLNSAFLNDGRCTQHPIAGIESPPGTKSDRDWKWSDQARRLKPMILEIVLGHGGPSALADLFNKEGFQLGPHCRKERWDHQIASGWIRNLILKGVRYRNKRKTKRNATGRYVSRKADPSELKTRHVPHLELFTADEFDAMQAVLIADGDAYRRGRKAAGDPRNGVPRKRTRGPGQMTYCGICGRKFVFGGHGQNDRLTCDGSRQYLCWNGATFDYKLASQTMLDAILQSYKLLPDFDVAFEALVNEEAIKLDADRNAERLKLDSELAGIDMELKNLIAFIRKGGESPSLRDELNVLEGRKAANSARRLQLCHMPTSTITIPSIEVLRTLVETQLRSFAIDTWEFRQVLGKIVPRLIVYPVQLLNGGEIVLRGEFDVTLGALLDDPRQKEVLAAPLTRRLVVDLFEMPERALHMEEVSRMRSMGLTFERIGAKLDITGTSAQNAMALRKVMGAKGLNDPYVRQFEVPTIPGRLSRHLHPRYDFKPLEGYPLR